MIVITRGRRWSGFVGGWTLGASGRDFDLSACPADTPTTQGLPLWCFNIVGGEILTFPDTPTTQGLPLWCFNIVFSSVKRLTLVRRTPRRPPPVGSGGGCNRNER